MKVKPGVNIHKIDAKSGKVLPAVISDEITELRLVPSREEFVKECMKKLSDLAFAQGLSREEFEALVSSIHTEVLRK